MGSPWVVAALAIAVFLAAEIVLRGALWLRELGSWSEVAAWYPDGSHASETSVRVRFPSRGYRICRRGNRYRAERIDAEGDVVDTFRVRRHLADAVRDTWIDHEQRVDVSPERVGGTGSADSALAGADGTWRTA